MARRPPPTPAARPAASRNCRCSRQAPPPVCALRAEALSACREIFHTLVRDGSEAAKTMLPGGLERDEFRMNRHRALAYCLSIIFSENRYPLFRIMLNSEDSLMTDTLRRVSRALLSVSDKTGLIEFARSLAARGVELVSTGGTAKAIAAAGLKVRDVSELTGFPEMMDGRVKTLHPKVHGGLLAIRDNSEHARAMKAHGIEPIDLLVVNLYPFEATVDKGADFTQCIENIDIGGPALIRAAAQNHDDVAGVVQAAGYQAPLDEPAANNGAATLAPPRPLPPKAYSRPP